MRFIRLSAIVTWLLAAGIALADEPLSSIPIDKCSVGAAFGSASMDASNREVEFGPRITASMEEVKAILAKYPDHAHDQQAVMNFLSPADNVRISEVLARNALLNMYAFAEDRAQRDFSVMMEMFTLAQAARDGNTDLMARALKTFKADENKQPRTGGEEEAEVIYVVLMRHIYKDAADPPDPASKTTCSVDLALALEDGRAYKTLTVMAEQDREISELKRIRQKYGAADNQPLNTTVMPPTEAKYVAELENAVQTKVQRYSDYHADLLNLRRLAAMSKMRYDLQREELVLGGGASKEDISAMEAIDAEKFKSLPSDMQKAWNLWGRIDTEVPSMMEKMLQSH